MKRRIYRIRNKWLVQGDPNLLTADEILVKEDENGVRLLQRDGAEEKDIAYNPADRPEVPEDPYENVVWGKIHYRLQMDETPNGFNGDPYIVFPYTNKYRYVFFIRRPLNPYAPDTVDIDIIICKKGNISETHRVTGVKYKTLYFCDTEGNISEVPIGKTYRVRNCGGELIDTVAFRFMSTSIKSSVPVKEFNYSGIKDKPFKVYGTIIGNGNNFRDIYYYFYKKNRLSPDTHLWKDVVSAINIKIGYS